MTKRLISISAIFFAYLVFVSQASANVITVEYAGFSQGSVNVNQSLDGSSRNAAAGMFDLDVISSNTPWIFPNSSLQAFCIELDQYIITNSAVEYNVLNANQFFNNSAQVESMGRLFTTAFDSVVEQTTSTNKRLYSSAFQLAMWELVYDFDAIDLLNNRFVTDSRSSRASVRSIADSWLGSLGSVTNKYTVSVLQSDASQDLIIARQNETPVTAPSVVIIMLAGALILGWRLKSTK